MSGDVAGPVSLLRQDKMCVCECFAFVLTEREKSLGVIREYHVMTHAFLWGTSQIVPNAFLPSPSKLPVEQVLQGYQENPRQPTTSSRALVCLAPSCLTSPPHRTVPVACNISLLLACVFLARQNPSIPQSQDRPVSAVPALSHPDGGQETICPSV